MNSDYKELYEAAKAAGASPVALEWIKQQEKPISELTSEEITRVTANGYLNWVAEKLPQFKALVTPTPEQYERGLTDEKPYVRTAWAMRNDLTPTPEQYERGLTDEDGWVRMLWAERKDLTPTPEQYERGMKDTDQCVRRSWVERKDLTPTPEQYKRGLTDTDWWVRRAWAWREE